MPISSTGLRYFVGVAKAGSIRQAAETMNVAASAVSRQLQMLEEEFGTALFERRRGRRNLRLTEAGQLLLDYAQLIENELEQVRLNVRSIDNLQRGTVRIGASESLARSRFLLGLLGRFRERYPGVSFQLTVAGGTRVIEHLSKDEIDLALAYRPPDSFDISVLAEASVTPSLLVSTAHPYASRSSVDVAECADLDLALPDESLTIRETYARMFARAGINPRVVLTTNSFELMRYAAITGFCHAIVNQYYGEHEISADVVYVPLSGEGVEEWPLRLCARTGRNLPIAARVFLDHLVAAMGDVERSSSDADRERDPKQG